MSRLRNLGVGAALLLSPLALDGDAPNPTEFSQKVATDTHEVGSVTDPEADLFDELPSEDGLQERLEVLKGEVVDASIDGMRGALDVSRDASPFLLLGGFALYRGYLSWRKEEYSDGVRKLSHRGIVDYSDSGSSSRLRDMAKAVTGTMPALVPVAAAFILAGVGTDSALVASGRRPFEKIAAITNPNVDTKDIFWALPEGETNPFSSGTIDLPKKPGADLTLFSNNFVSGELLKGETVTSAGLHVVGLPEDKLPESTYDGGVVSDSQELRPGQNQLVVGGALYDIVETTDGGSSLDRLLVLKPTEFDEKSEQPFGIIIHADNKEDASQTLEDAGVDPRHTEIFSHDGLLKAIDDKFSETVSPIMTQQVMIALLFGGAAMMGMAAMRAESQRRQVGMLRSIGAPKNQIVDIMGSEVLRNTVKGGIIALPFSASVLKFTDAAQVGVEVNFFSVGMARDAAATLALVGLAQSFAAGRTVARQLRKTPVELARN